MSSSPETATNGFPMSDAEPPKAAMARVLRVPDRYRRFTVQRSELARRHGISDAILVQLLHLGLPCRDGKFDRLDLDNIGLALRLPCSRNTAMRWWSRSLRESSIKPPADTLLMRAQCPAPGHSGECGFALAPELADALVSQGRQAPSGAWFKLCVSLKAPLWVFGPPFTELFEQVLPLQFHLIPPVLANDLDFLTSTGLADCELATAFLVNQAAELGLQVRAASGIFVARPYPVEHCWIECRVDDGRWLAADPFLINALRRWGIIDGPEWSADWSLQSVLWRTGTAFGHLVMHGDRAAPYLITVGLP
jgi:hypothetical protein